MHTHDMPKRTLYRLIFRMQMLNFDIVFKFLCKCYLVVPNRNLFGQVVLEFWKYRD